MLAWLIRHAESEANAGLATDQPAATALTERGRMQARHLAAWFEEPPALVVTSAYARTKQTARPTRERFPDVPSEEWPVEEFTYLNSLHGKSLTAAERRPFIDAYWRRADPDWIESPGAESFDALLGRARDAVDRIERAGDGPVAVFTHGVFMRAMLWSLLVGAGDPTPESMRLFRAFTLSSRIPNTAVLDLHLGTGDPAVWMLGGRPSHLSDDLVTGS